MNKSFLFVVLGLVAGILSGLIGIGGGVVVVPALAFMFGFSQHEAQGTTLAMMIPPIGLLAAWRYYKDGQVNTRVALLLCLGFFVGGFLGAKLAGSLSNAALQKVFGGALLIIGARMLLK